MNYLKNQLISGSFRNFTYLCKGKTLLLRAIIIIIIAIDLTTYFVGFLLCLPNCIEGSSSFNKLSVLKMQRFLALYVIVYFP